MTPHKTVILESGPAIRYQIKKVLGVSFLVINTNFKPLSHPALVQGEWLSVSGVEAMDSTGIYDDNTGYVIYHLAPIYFTDFLYMNIETKFKQYFKCQPLKS